MGDGGISGSKANHEGRNIPPVLGFSVCLLRDLHGLSGPIRRAEARFLMIRCLCPRGKQANVAHQDPVSFQYHLVLNVAHRVFKRPSLF